MKLSIIIPAYNEERRLPPTLEGTYKELSDASVDFEIIIADDGSRDGTRAYVESFMQTHPRVKILSEYPNHGRGAAVRRGVREAQGELVLETDADGSVSLEAIVRFVQYFDAHPDTDVICGSREMKGAVLLQPQPWLRVFLGYGFLYLAKAVLRSWWTTDFTLGFKMLRKDAAQDVFAHQYDNHYVAEAEIVFVAHQRGWRVVELPVSWTDNRESRVRPFRDSFRSFRGLMQIIIRDMQGLYKNK